MSATMTNFLFTFIQWCKLSKSNLPSVSGVYQLTMSDTRISGTNISENDDCLINLEQKENNLTWNKS